jgi:hypothetical protein
MAGTAWLWLLAGMQAAKKCTAVRLSRKCSECWSVGRAGIPTRRIQLSSCTALHVCGRGGQSQREERDDDRLLTQSSGLLTATAVQQCIRKHVTFLLGSHLQRPCTAVCDCSICRVPHARVCTGCCPLPLLVPCCPLSSRGRSRSSKAVRRSVHPLSLHSDPKLGHYYTATAHTAGVARPRPHVGPRPVARGSTIDGLPTQESVFPATSAQGV